jgi:hypothetical protein
MLFIFEKVTPLSSGSEFSFLQLFEKQQKINATNVIEFFMCYFLIDGLS